jgi:hypothetical protein
MRSYRVALEILHLKMNSSLIEIEIVEVIDHLFRQLLSVAQRISQQ